MSGVSASIATIDRAGAPALNKSLSADLVNNAGLGSILVSVGCVSMSSISSSSSLTMSANANPSWLASAWSAMQQPTGGILGALQNSKNLDGSNSSFLSLSSGFANSLATISQNNFSSGATLTAQVVDANQQKQQADALQKALSSLSGPPPAPGPKLDPMIFFGNGSTLDTQNNILTMSDGTQIDTTTGMKIQNPANIMELGNGSYIDLANNIMTLSNGMQIDTVTGQTVSVTA